jgi:hypothetical protein
LEGIAINTAIDAFLGKDVPIGIVVQEVLDRGAREVANLERASEAIKKELERKRSLQEQRIIAAERWQSECEQNPEALPDPCLLPDRDLLKRQIEAKRRKARAKWLSLYAIYVLCFNLPDGFDEEIDRFGTACDRIALMSLLARLGYQIVGLNAQKGEITIRRCYDGEWRTDGLALHLVPPEILQAIEAWGAVRFDVEFGFRPDGTYGVVGTNNCTTPILFHFPLRIQRPELWFNGTEGAEGPFYDHPMSFDNYVFPRGPP